MITVHDLPYKDKIEMMCLKDLLPKTFNTTISLYESEWVENMEHDNIDINAYASQLEISKSKIINLRRILFSRIGDFSKEYKDEIYRFTEYLMTQKVSTIDDFKNILLYIERKYKEIYKYFLIYNIKEVNLLFLFIRDYLIYISQAVDFMTKYNLRNAISDSSIDSNPFCKMEINCLKNIIKGCFSSNKTLSEISKKHFSYLLKLNGEYFSIFDACSEKIDDPIDNRDIFNVTNDIVNREALFNPRTNVSIIGPKIWKEDNDKFYAIKLIERIKNKIKEELSSDSSIFLLNEDWIIYLIKHNRLPITCIRTENGPSYITLINGKRYLLFLYKDELRGVNIKNINELMIVKKDINGEFKYNKDEIFK